MWSKCASSFFFLLFFLFWSSFFFVFFFCQRERETHETHSFNFIFYGLEDCSVQHDEKKASFRALLFPQIETFHWSLLSVMHITFSLLHEQSSSLLLQRHHLVFALSKRVVWSDDDDAFFVGGGRGGGRGVAKTHRAATRKRRTRGRRATFFRARCARFFRGGRIAVKESGHCGPLE